MSEWWKNPVPEEGETAEIARAYFKGFLADDNGRKLLAHIRIMAEAGHTEATEPLLRAFEIRTRINFVEWIRSMCGPFDELGRIEAEAVIASGTIEQSGQRPELEGFERNDNEELEGFKE